MFRRAGENKSPVCEMNSNYFDANEKIDPYNRIIKLKKTDFVDHDR